MCACKLYLNFTFGGTNLVRIERVDMGYYVASDYLAILLYCVAFREEAAKKVIKQVFRNRVIVNFLK